MRNVLVVYSLVQHPVRQTIRDALEAFEDYSDARCFFLNLAVRRNPWWLRRVRFDAIILHATFLCTRCEIRHHSCASWSERGGSRGVAEPRSRCPQDEFLRSRMVEGFADSLGSTTVFSGRVALDLAAALSESRGPRRDLAGPDDGSLHPRTVARIGRIVESSPERPIDIGYRAWSAEPWLGRHGALKVRIAEAVERAARRGGADRRPDTGLGHADGG